MQTPKRIAFLITSTGWGGLEMNTIKLAQAFCERGLEVYLITTSDATIVQKQSGIFKATLTFKKIPKYFAFAKARAISKFLEQHQVPTLFLVDNKNIDVAAWTKRFYLPKLKILYQQHMQMGLDKKDLIHTFRFQAIDYWISPLECLKKEVVERTRIQASSIKVVPIGIPTQQLGKRKQSKKAARLELGIPEELLLVGVIGRITEKKGQLGVVQAIEYLKSQGKSYRLVLFGSPTVNEPESIEYEASIQQYCVQHNIDTLVHRVPYQTNTGVFYDAIDIFFLPSEKETYGMVTLEALWYGIPIIGTNSGGTVELLDKGKRGTLVSYNSIKEYAEAIDSIGKNIEYYMEKASEHRNQIRETFDLEVEITGLLELV
ncbi:MAG: glycosyltransferase family 4 protein [Cytophagaceae bacterium]|jgi:glycosyltransferase involved in cell wall biosynthesis|nr:glycosyltransferase family 4 protein [Cytophagaceae bacterium]